MEGRPAAVRHCSMFLDISLFGLFNAMTGGGCGSQSPRLAISEMLVVISKVLSKGLLH
jgi:hypothetical protein